MAANHMAKQYVAGAKKLTLLHCFWTHSAWVIYAIKCKICNLLFIRISETKCNIRFNNHQSHIRNSINNFKLSLHFLHNRPTHDFKKDVTIRLIEQIQKEHLELNAKRDLLCKIGRAHV